MGKQRRLEVTNPWVTLLCPQLWLYQPSLGALEVISFTFVMTVIIYVFFFILNEKKDI